MTVGYKAKGHGGIQGYFDGSLARNSATFDAITLRLSDGKFAFDVAMSTTRNSGPASSLASEMCMAVSTASDTSSEK